MLGRCGGLTSVLAPWLARAGACGPACVLTSAGWLLPLVASKIRACTVSARDSGSAPLPGKFSVTSLQPPQPPASFSQLVPP